MVNISILQSEGDTANPSITLPDSFVALKDTDTTSDFFFQVLEKFLRDGERKVLKKLTGPAAAEVADFLDELITMKLSNQPKFRGRTIRVLRSLCGSWGVLPASYTLEGEVTVTAKNPWTCAGFGEIWCGTWESEKVAVKIIKITGSANPAKLKKLSNEAIIWKKLKHRNLLPLFGVSAGIKIAGINYEHPCLVSPWMENGDIRVFARKNPTFNRFKLLVDVCEGLRYLHSEGFVHGDLKGDNVLIDHGRRACLADFGFAGVCGPFGTTGVSNSSDVGGTAAYMAPELLFHQVNKDRSNAPPPKKPVDIYALGMLMYEVLAGQQPFHGIRCDVIKHSVANGDRPKPPPWTSIPDHLWHMIEQCWRHEPAERPQLAGIFHILDSVSVDLPTEWPSPPVTPSTTSIPSSSPQVPPMSVLPILELPDPSSATPDIPAAGLRLPPRCKLCLGYILHPVPSSPPPILRPIDPDFPAPAVAHYRPDGPKPRVIIVYFDATRQNLAFRWRAAGSGITKQRPGTTNRGTGKMGAGCVLT